MRSGRWRWNGVPDPVWEWFAVRVGCEKLAVVQNGQNRKSGKGRWHGQWGVAGIYVIIEQVPGVSKML